MKVLPASHVDHVPAEVVAFVADKFKDADKFFIETFELPDHLPTLENALYGPTMGDVVLDWNLCGTGRRPGRNYDSQLIRLPKRQTRTCTVIAGPHEGESCVLYTVFGGPVTPKEPNDPTLKPEERHASVIFWTVHALAIGDENIALTPLE